MATEKRQEEIRDLAKKNGAVVIIGSKTSANSQRLFEIAKGINQKTYFIRKASELKKEWFSNIKTTAITAGASTPDWVIKEVVERLKTY